MIRQSAPVNEGVALPNQEITVVHRLDDSGTTYIWTDYLSKVSSEWKSRVGQGTSVEWPVGLAATGDEGVSEKIREVKGAIGYVELSYAQKTKVAFGCVRNSEGRFIAASLAGIKKSAASIVGTQSDLRVSMSNASGINAYPIASFHLDFSSCTSEEFRDKESLEGVSGLDRDGRPKVRDRPLLFASADGSRSRGASSER